MKGERSKRQLHLSTVANHVNNLIDKTKLFWDQYQYLGNCPPTPPLTQQQSTDNKLGLMLG